MYSLCIKIDIDTQSEKETHQEILIARSIRWKIIMSLPQRFPDSKHELSEFFYI